MINFGHQQQVTHQLATAYNIANATGKVSAATTKTNASGYRYLPCRTFTVTGTILT
jgi:hypothetical protein